jgi:hypothetical protein
MKLDRYTTGVPKYKVLRHQPDGSYVEVDPWECFVLKRRDMNTLTALDAYAGSAEANGDVELADEVERLIVDWTRLNRSNKDEKMPD